MGSFARIAAEALSEFIGGADDVVTKGSDDLVATSVKAKVKIKKLKSPKITRALDPDDPDVLSDIARKNGTFPKRVQEALFAWNKRDGGISSKELRKILKEEGWADNLNIREVIFDANNVGTTQLLPPKSFDPEQKALTFEFNKGGIVKKGLMAR
jgi:hypothetical protein